MNKRLKKQTCVSEYADCKMLGASTQCNAGQARPVLDRHVDLWTSVGWLHENGRPQCGVRGGCAACRLHCLVLFEHIRWPLHAGKHQAEMKHGSGYLEPQTMASRWHMQPRRQLDLF